MADKKPAMALMIGKMDKPGSMPAEPDHDEGEFKAPEGFDMEGKKPGDTIEAVVELEVKDRGMLCVKKLNGMDVGGYGDDKPDEDEAPPEKGGFTDSVMGGESPPEEEQEGM